MNIPSLYMIIRNDLDSMNAGKAMAQISHASNAFVKLGKQIEVNSRPGENIDLLNAFDAWQNQTSQGFGTAIVLQADIKTIRDIDLACRDSVVSDELYSGVIASIVVDPTYPLRDGSVTHLLNLETCSFYFAVPTEFVGYRLVSDLLKKLPLA